MCMHIKEGAGNTLYMHLQVSIMPACLFTSVCVCVGVGARINASLLLYVKVCSSAILLREQFLNVSLAPVGLNFLVLEDYGKNVRDTLR